MRGGSADALEKCYRERTAQRFIEDFLLNYYTITELAERFSISPKTAHKWIKRFVQHGQAGFRELSRWQHSLPW